jgi:alpha-galactosidase
MAASYRLTGGGEAIVFVARGAGAPELVAWGPDTIEAADPALGSERSVAHGMLDVGEVLSQMPEAAWGFTGAPGLLLHRNGVQLSTRLTLAEADVQGGAAVFTLRDEGEGVRVDLHVSLNDFGVLEAFAELVNEGASDLGIERLAISLPCPHDEVLAFGGRWAGEFSGSRRRIDTGAYVQENHTGRTSHHAPPFLLVGEPGFGETHGEVLAAHLAWSGDTRLAVERLRDGRLHFQASELLATGEVVLKPGERHRTPVLHAARSGAGLNGVSDRLHPHVRERIMRGRLRGRPRPVRLNTWEACYFDHDLGALRELAGLAAEAGVERFVLDDGWFLNRTNATRGLGDWTPDPTKFPNGLKPLMDHVHGLGMSFGLWVEPEMANADSELLRAHPEWFLGRLEQPLGRDQFWLDLTRPEVFEQVSIALHRLLSENAIDALKWDCNRDVSDAFSGGRPAGRRQVEAAYALMDGVRAAHPGVEIEACASGGARADYAMLERADRIWTSDNNDPVDRQAIQRAFSIFFPPEVMGAHIGPDPSHITGRRSTLAFRAATALFGQLGLELDLRSLTAEERRELGEWIALHKRLRPLLHGSRLQRLPSADPARVAFAVVGDNEALVSVAQTDSPRHATPEPIRIAGLEPRRRFRVTTLSLPADPAKAARRAPPLGRGETLEVNGAWLAAVGLQLPILRAGEALILHLETEA